MINHVKYTGLSTEVKSIGFGQVTSVGAMRQIRLNFRVMF